MTEKSYLALFDLLRARKGLLKFLTALQKLCEAGVFLLYPAFLVYLFFKGNDFWIVSAAVCLAGFVGVSFLRVRLKQERPYERYGFTPLIKKETAGRSCPSRHAFSAAIIAVNIGVISPLLGAAVFTAAVIISALRVMFGVHFIKDVLSGLILGAGIGLTVLFF